MPAEYVGYTSPKSPPTFFTCVRDYSDTLLPSNVANGVTEHIHALGDASGYHFAIQHNDSNGAKPIPTGFSLVQHVKYAYQIRQCPRPGVGPTAGIQKSDFEMIEYFRTGPDGKAAVDNQMLFFPCECIVEPIPGKHTIKLQAAILPDDSNWPNIPNGDNAGNTYDPMSDLDKYVKLLQQLISKVTLSLWWDYTYNGCPPGANSHSLQFYAATYDPPNPNPTWSIGPVQYP